MYEEGSGESRGALDGSRAFWMRITEILFRHPIRFLFPLLAFAAIGAAIASQSTSLYQSQGVLSAAANPLVSDSEIRGTSIEAWESPAEGTSRIISEQLRTAAFMEGVVERAGLSYAIDSDVITLDTVRTNVWTATQGNSLLTVNAQWADPRTAHQLVTATIDSYHDFLEETVTSDSSEAEQYFSELRDEAQADLDAAQQELSTYVAELPDLAEGEQQPIQVVITIESLTDRIDRAEEQVASARADIVATRLNVLQAQSEAGRSLIIVDEPVVPTYPVGGLRATIQTVGIFVILGGILSVILLVAATMIDRSVSSPADLALIPGISLTAAVPPLSRIERKQQHRKSQPASDEDKQMFTTSEQPVTA